MTDQPEFFDITQQGLIWLREDMEKSSSFDPNKPYDEKNTYFARANVPGFHLLRSGLHIVAELYFERILAEILSFEQAKGKKFNKGMVYANLGIAQICRGEFEAGIANFLTAEREDRPVAPSNWNILDTELWHQFEYQIVQIILATIENSDLNSIFVADEVFVNNMLKAMEQQDRIFLEGTILILNKN